MFLELNLPKFLWEYAAMNVTYIQNCCYCQHEDNTLYELITKLKPNIAKLHAFESISYSYVQNSKTLDAHSRKGYFVGYDKESPLYLVYFPENNSVMKYRVIIFKKFEMSRVPIDESGLFTDKNENIPENVVKSMSLPFEEY